MIKKRRNVNMKHYEMFTGRVGQVRDLVELKDGNCVVNFSVAESTRVKGADDKWKDGVTVWTDVSIFGDEARNFVKSVKPGTFVTVSGTRTAREFTDKNTNELRVVQQVAADQVAIAITKFNYVKEIGNVNYYKEGRGGEAASGNSSKPAGDTKKTEADPFNNNESSSGENAFGDDDDDPFGLS